MAEGSDLQQCSSMEESFYEDKVFYGPMTEYEKQIREKFEKAMKEKGHLLPHFNDSIREDSEDSRYESFSTESKYESFNDSLNDARDLNSLDKRTSPKEINASNFLSEQVNCKKILNDKKNLAGQLCDSLEDIHSLVSSGDRFSLSEEIEDINIVEMSHTCDDSLRNDICAANKLSSDQCFDEDSLAILEHEKAFDDSLEDSNGPSVSHLDSLMLSKSKAHDVDSLNEKVPEENKVTKSYFEPSIHVIYENLAKEDGIDAGSLDDCNKKCLYLSEGNPYRDSLEDLSDLPNHQNTSSCSSYKSVSAGPLAMNSSNDLNDNKPESKLPKQNDNIEDFNLILNQSTTRKSSTTFLKPLTELAKAQNANINETICIDDSVLPSDSDIDSCPANLNTESVNLKSEVSAHKTATKLSLSPLDTNNTICIDDSVISSSFATACSFLTNNFAPESTVNSDAFCSMEVDKAFEENVKNSNTDDTIWIEDSIIEPVEKQPGSTEGLVLDDVKDNNIFINNTFIIDPVISSKPLGFTDANETICIDDSVVLPSESDSKDEISAMEDQKVNKNKRLGKNFEKDFQKLRISDMDKHHMSPSANAGSTLIDIVVRSPVHGCQNNSNISDKSNMRRKKENSSLASPETLNERNLKVHIELKNQEVNVISVSEEQCTSPKKAAKYISNESKIKKEHREKDSNFEIVRIKSNDACSQKNSPLGLCSMSRQLEPYTTHFSKNKVDQNRFLDDLDVKFGGHDISLFQALDLHDASINMSKNESFLSRDSAKPLNLCVRERSFERPSKIPRNESKENIPSFISRKKFVTKEQNTPKHLKLKPATPKKVTPLKNTPVKQQLNNHETKKAATKIPIRKLNIPVFQKKQKVDIKPSNKPVKSPFVVPSCPVATEHKEVSEETPKKSHNHHFCMIRNSISRVPKSSQKIAPKKFQNIQSPVAMYIGNPSVQIPLKSTHRYDGNQFPTNAEPPVAGLKTPKKIGPSATANLVKSDKKF